VEPLIVKESAGICASAPGMNRKKMMAVSVNNLMVKGLNSIWFLVADALIC
jgi:hypothetical protein